MRTTFLAAMVALAVAGGARAEDGWYFDPAGAEGAPETYVRSGDATVLTFRCGQSGFGPAVHLTPENAHLAIGNRRAPNREWQASGRYDPVKRIRAGQPISLTEVDGTRIADLPSEGAWLALRTLFGLCHTTQAISDGPSFDCQLPADNYQHYICQSPDLTALEREVTARFTALALAAEPEERRSLWRDHASFLTTADACPTHDAACIQAALAARLAALPAGAPPAPDGPDPSPPLDPQAVLADHAAILQANGINHAEPLDVRGEVAYFVVDDPQNPQSLTGPVVVAVHDIAEDRPIDPSAPEHFAVMAERMEAAMEARGREGGTVAMYHIVKSRALSEPSVEGYIGLAPSSYLARANYTRVWRRQGQERIYEWRRDVVETVTYPAETVSFAEAQAMVDERIAADASRSRQIEGEREARRTAFLAAEADKAAAAAAGGWVYRSPEFWRRFSNPTAVEAIFSGRPDNLSRPLVMAHVEAWAIAYADQCGDHIPEGEGGALITTTTTFNVQTGERIGGTSTREVRVTRAFFPAIEAFVAWDQSASKAASDWRERLDVAREFLGTLDASPQQQFSDLLEMTGRTIARKYTPGWDMTALVRHSGCTSATTQQFEANLVRAATGQPALQNGGPALRDAAADSDPLQQAGRMPSLAMACWEYEGFGLYSSSEVAFCSCFGDAATALLPGGETEQAIADYRGFFQRIRAGSLPREVTQAYSQCLQIAGR